MLSAPCESRKLFFKFNTSFAKVVLQSRIGLYLLQLHPYSSFLPHQQLSQLYPESTPAVDTLHHPNPENGNSKSKPKELATNWPEDTLDVCPSSLPTHHPKYHRHRGCPLSFRLIILDTLDVSPLSLRLIILNTEIIAKKSLNILLQKGRIQTLETSVVI